MTQADHQHSQSQLSEIIDAGLPLADGLRAVASDALSRRDRRSLTRLAIRLEQGASVAEALEQARYTPPLIRELVQEGIRSGKLAHVLQEYLRTSREIRSIRRHFIARLAYPAIVAGLAACIFQMFLTFAIPQFQNLYADFGIELPALTNVLIFLSTHITLSWLAFVGVMLVILLLVIGHRLLPGRGGRCRVLQSVPLIGPAQRLAASAEFCSRLAILIDCRVPLERCMEVLSTSLNDAHLSSVASQLGKQLEAGANPQEFSRGVPGMLPALSNAFRWSTDSELFSDGLHSLAELFGTQARIRTGQIGFIIEPVAIVGIGLAAGFTALACVLPLIRLMTMFS